MSPGYRSLDPREQLRTFAGAIFAPSDIVEIRAISSASNSGMGRAEVLDRRWLPAQELEGLYPLLQELNNKGANIYFGVNPRAARGGGTKADVRCCSALWADLDNCSVADAKAHWQRIDRAPTLVVNSGHGVHLYWKLAEPVQFLTASNRTHIERLLKNLYADIKSDSTQDVTRLLRLPGFQNVKRAPVPCVIDTFEPDIAYSLVDFARWAQPKAESRSEKQPPSPSLKEIAFTGQFSHHESGSVDMRRVRGLIATLDRETDDRSRRDFWVACQLLRLGLSADEVCQLVDGHSKFQTAEYTTHTVQKAIVSLTKSS